jgi:hypothetical protein
MKYRTKIKALLMSIIVFLSSINIFAIIANAQNKKPEAKTAGVSCYFAGPDIKKSLPVELEALDNQLLDLKNLYEEGKINKETYETRKIELQKKYTHPAKEQPEEEQIDLDNKSSAEES